MVKWACPRSAGARLSTTETGNEANLAHARVLHGPGKVSLDLSTVYVTHDLDYKFYASLNEQNLVFYTC